MSVEEFAADIRTAPVTGGNDVDLAGPLAHHLTTLGYRKPRTLIAFQELEALPTGSAVETSDESDTVLLRDRDGWFRNQEGYNLTPTDLWRYGTHPFTVIYEPGAES